jgi:hypothetical protein
MPNREEDDAITIADMKAKDLATELRRRVLGQPSLRKFRRLSDALLERAVWAHWHELEDLAR